ncbi:Murein DD-endopeptidase MepM [Polaribacter huanghezhanensis]|uniref:M23 family metallopeptidase n=1 Tax=Polaribacter huanghezhanensis TaxID=1354726 RepID=UPI0026473E2D|nr:M23 family metallopeptidase [Polaribacter huanghezhanensis]WKD85153.1 Murein DD-endopeptidase MepM [Polaribacter huanghezhanensis]
MAKKKQKKSKFRQKITDKFRLVVLNEDTFEERLSFKLTILNIFVLSGVFSIVLIALTTVLIAYTPIREYIPGYASTQLKKDASRLLYETDSLKTRLELIENYTKILLPILSGDDPISEVDFDSLKKASVITIDEKKLDASKRDSLFREKIESKDRFPLFDKAENKIDMVFFSPLNGSITQGFNITDKHFAIDIVAATGTPVKAVENGRVIFSEWTAETGYVIIIEHGTGFISVYKHNGTLLKQQGDFVKSGEAIATVGSTGELTTGPHLHFELWYNGYPVNPLNYIDFK